MKTNNQHDKPPTKLGSTSIEKETIDLKKFGHEQTAENDNDSHKQTESTIVSEQKTFTEEELKQVWEQNLSARKEKEAPESELSILRRKWSLSEYNVIVPITSKLEESFASRFEQELTLFLRKELKNSEITIQWVLNEITDEKKKLYTGQDKFEALAEQNPLLRELKDRLGLDYDF